MSKSQTLTMEAAGRSSGPIGWAESGLVPDTLIRAGIRRLNRQRLKDIHAHDEEWMSVALNDFVARMRTAEVAPLPHKANEQHYEVPAAFFGEVMARHRKYSCCYWTRETRNLEEAEAEALARTCAHAQIEDGQTVLDLGCGWGSLSLWIAEHYPGSQVTAVSNSRPQREYIETQARERGLDNIQVLTRDMNVFRPDGRFDRIVSVEMFEHMRNYQELFGRISSWLEPRGRFFMHIFCHRAAAYEFVDAGQNDWMSRHFFSGGIMPSADLPLRFQRHLELHSQWRWSGQHYEKTANAWLQNMDERRDRILPILSDCYGEEQASLWFQRWRIFFMACAEMFGHDQGREWFVGHYLFRRGAEA